jgi:hypothetical protein
MADVERIRKAAERRIAQGRVGMVLTCRQILDLIERGDHCTNVARQKRGPNDGKLERIGGG